MRIEEVPTNGITPTPVENTMNKKRKQNNTQDHPHTCGEYRPRVLHLSYIQGSPPHLWGILMSHTPGKGVLGITPTPVGNTLKKTYYTGILILAIPRFSSLCF